MLGLIQVNALFHLAQRPLLVRNIRFETEGKEGFGEEQHVYVMATKQDYDNTMALWGQVRETTETSAASHHLKFFHEVVEPVAKQKSLFTIKDLTDAWNAKFIERKSSDTIRNYVDFLCLIGYMSKEPDPSDKRQNLLKVIQEQNGKYTENELSVFFTLESFKAWINEVQTITEENQISLRENLLTDTETTPEAIYNKYFPCEDQSFVNENKHPSLDETQDSSINVLSLNQSPTVESAQEETDKQKIVQSPNINADNVQRLERLKGDFQDKCASCGFQGRMDWQATEHNGSWSLLCGDCGLKLEKRLGEVRLKAEVKGACDVLNGRNRFSENQGHG